MKNGAPERIRTSDLWFRRPTLYPTELQARGFILNDWGSSVILVSCILTEETKNPRTDFHFFDGIAGVLHLRYR